MCGTWRDGAPAINARVKTQKGNIAWATCKGDIYGHFLGVGAGRAVWAMSDAVVLKYEFSHHGCNMAGFVSLLCHTPLPLPCPALLGTASRHRWRRRHSPHHQLQYGQFL